MSDFAVVLLLVVLFSLSLALLLGMDRLMES